MSKILITGGAGYIGSHVTKLLHDRNYETIVLDTLENGHKEAIIGEFVQGSYGDENLLNEIFEKNEIKIVIHLGAYASVPDSGKNPQIYYANNVSNMITLLNTCVKYKVKNFIFSSSASTFGEPISDIIFESHPQKPINPYGFTKLIGEHLLKDYHKAYGINYCIFRYFCAAGADKSGIIGEAHYPETHLIPVMIKKALNNESIPVCGMHYNTKDGSCIRDFIHVLDLAQAHFIVVEKMMNNDFESNDFNLGSGTGFSVLEMISKLEVILQKDISFVDVGVRAGDPKILIANYSKAEKILNWTPEHSNITEILTDAVAWERGRKY